MFALKTKSPFVNLELEHGALIDLRARPPQVKIMNNPEKLSH